MLWSVEIFRLNYEGAFKHFNIPYLSIICISYDLNVSK